MNKWFGALDLSGAEGGGKAATHRKLNIEAIHEEDQSIQFRASEASDAASHAALATICHQWLQEVCCSRMWQVNFLENLTWPKRSRAEEENVSVAVLDYPWPMICWLNVQLAGDSSISGRRLRPAGQLVHITTDAVNIPSPEMLSAFAEISPQS